MAWGIDEWGNLLNEENPHHLHQPYRCRGSSMMRNQDCTITGTGTRPATGEVYHPGSNRAKR